MKSMKMILPKYQDYANTLLSICGIYLVWIIVHYISSHLYIRFCVASTFIGFLLSPFIAPAVHCQALRWAIYNGGNSIIAMWFILGGWLMRYIVPIRHE